jgi:hypothetical protein
MGSNIRIAAIGPLSIFVLVLVLAGWTSEVLALDDETTRFSLTGLRGIAVVVKDINPDAERDGLKRDQIKTDVELRLRETGIKVPTESERLAIPDFPLLTINVDVEKSKDLELYNYNIEVELYKQVISNPHDETRFAEYDQIKTWSSGLTTSIPSNGLKSSVQKDVVYLVDKFISAYLAANPKNKTD